jgi:hypothetical protein
VEGEGEGRLFVGGAIEALMIFGGEGTLSGDRNDGRHYAP